VEQITVCESANSSPRHLDDRHEHGRRGHQRDVDPAAEASRREREHEVDEPEQGEVLDRRRPCTARTAGVVEVRPAGMPTPACSKRIGLRGVVSGT
jgi:hypothetical protein